MGAVVKILGAGNFVQVGSTLLLVVETGKYLHSTLTITNCQLIVVDGMRGLQNQIHWQSKGI